jgi:hypothetical protein
VGEAGAIRPIIFSGPMIRALLDGRKTQTRRLLRNPEYYGCPTGDCPHERQAECDAAMAGLSAKEIGFAIGDRCYVREAAWIAPPAWTDSPVNPMGPQRQEVAYAADDRSGYTRNAANDYKLRLRPSIHMPRWASRLTLFVDDVRVQRLQDISEADAVAEGIEARGVGVLWGWFDYLETNPNLTRHFADPRKSYASLWDSLHTAAGTRWDDNPWIYALTFRVARGNIDQLETMHDDHP